MKNKIKLATPDQGTTYHKALVQTSLGCGFAPPPLGFTEFGATAPSALAKSGVQFLAGVTLN